MSDPVPGATAGRARPIPPPPLPPVARALIAILILIPLVGLAVVPLYSSDHPRLWGFPFFYWYQFAWVFLAAACTGTAYAIVHRHRGGTR